jgi:multidrug efflux pump subunit AcrA (membrane-fusion protein)
VPVRLGEGAGAWSEVLGAIEPGDTVVTRGNERLRAGQSVTAEHQDYPLP